MAGPPIGTRDKIQDAAQALILTQGFAATSIEQIIARVGLTKGAFFHHFKSKAELARALIDRYAAADLALLRETMARAEKLSSDPLQQLLIFVGLLIEMTERMDDSDGCLFASYCYESGQFDDDMNGLLAESIHAWRSAISAKLEAAVAKHPTRLPVEVESLADLLTVILEGAHILARVFKQPEMLPRQLRYYRSHLELLFDL